MSVALTGKRAGFDRTPGGFMHPENQNGDRDDAGQSRQPEYGAIITPRQRHDRDRQQRPEKGADGIERLSQTVGRTPLMRRRQFGDQGIPGRAAQALAEPVEKPRGEYQTHAGGQGEQRLGQRAEQVTGYDQALAPFQPVAEIAREHPGDQGKPLAGAFDQADAGRAGADHRHQEDRQQAMDHLRGDVHERADQAKRPDAPGEGHTRGRWQPDRTSLDMLRV